MSDNVLGFPHGKRPGDYLPCDVEPPCEGNGTIRYTPPEITETDPVHHPAHYNRNGVEAIDVIQHVIADYPACYAYAIGNVVKYLCRAMYKGNFAQDIEKAHWYLSYVVRQVRDATRESQIR